MNHDHDHKINPESVAPLLAPARAVLASLSRFVSETRDQWIRASALFTAVAYRAERFSTGDETVDEQRLYDTASDFAYYIKNGETLLEAVSREERGE